MKGIFVTLFILLSFCVRAQNGSPITKDQIKDRSLGVEGIKNGYQTSVQGWIIRSGDTLNVGKGSLPNKDFAFLYENPMSFGDAMTSDSQNSRKYLPSNYSSRKVILKNLGISGNKKVGFGVYGLIGIGSLVRYYLELDNAIEAGEILPPPQYHKATSQVNSQTGSVADELIKLKQLLDAGVLTQEEFNTQKKKLLNQ